ncbi:pyridoxal phosphate-dependent transferase [Mycena olivaceomarginata]|nr:pyridoxal phosphate-dependent transferase [Mycena olivaceomarginata]
MRPYQLNAGGNQIVILIGLKPAAHQLLHDETNLDGNPLLNLASYTSPIHSDLRKLINGKTRIRSTSDEYPAATIIGNRCISMSRDLVADLWKVPKESKAIGTSTAGSSEAEMLGGLALKEALAGSPEGGGERPLSPQHCGASFGSNTHVVLEKFGRCGPSNLLCDVEAHLVPVNASTNYVMSTNIIGVSISRFWAFDVKRVHSINTSGHRFGLVYAGLGWILWKDESMLHKDLIFELHYLGSVEYSFFRKPCVGCTTSQFGFVSLSSLLNLIRPGFDGYCHITIKDLLNAHMFSRALDAPYFIVFSKHPQADDPELYERALPVISFRLSSSRREYPHVQQAWIQSMLRTKGWILPN